MSHVKKAEMAKMAAFNIVANEVYNPAFFTKLAAYGIVPQTEEQADSLLKAAAELRVAALQSFGNISHGSPEPELVKAASEMINQNQRIKSAAVLMAYNQ